MPNRRGCGLIGITAGAAILIITLALWEVQSHNSGLELVTIEESISDIESPSIGDSDPSIKTNGYWSLPIIGIYFDATQIEYSNEANQVVFDAIQGTGSIPSRNQFTGWHILFHAILESEGKTPTHLILVDREDAVVRVSLINDEHPQKKLGKTTLQVDKATRELYVADITIYRSDQLYENGLLRKVIVHEIGHALGLGHSTVQDDIMYQKVSVDNSTLYDVGACEFAAVRMLYQDHKVSENLKC